MQNEKLIRFDWAIKHLLRNKTNFDILEGFLSAVLNEKVQVLNLLESESNQEDERDKFNRVDLLVESGKGEQILIEIQVESELDFFHRIVFGTSKLITENMEKGDPYRKIKKVISISIAYFHLGRGKDYLYYGSTNFVGMNEGDQLTLSTNQKKSFGFTEVRRVFPEHYIIRVEKFGDEVRSAVDEWIYLLKNSEVKPEFESEHIQAASKKLTYMALDEEQQRGYREFMENQSYHNSMLWSSREEGRQLGREEGLQVGREEKTVALVKNSLNQKLPLETIAAIAEIDVAEVRRIQAELVL